MSGSERKIPGSIYVEPSVQLAIISAIKSELGDFRDEIIKHIDLKINPIEKTLDQHTEDIKKLYDNDIAMMNRVSALERLQSASESAATTTEKVTEGFNRKQEISTGKIALIVTICIALGTMIGWILGDI